MPIDTSFGRPRQDCVRGQLGAVVAADRLGLAVTGDEAVEFARDPSSRQREVGDRSQALARADIVDRQDAQPSPAVQLIGDEVQDPQIVRLRRHRHRRPRA
jgi:hypothetical protein